MITKEEIRQIATEVAAQIAAAITEVLKGTAPATQKALLTVEEACEYTTLSLSAIYKKTHNRLIPYYKPDGGKIFFKREDLDNWMMSCRVATDEELRRKAATYCMKNPLRAK